MCTAPVTALAVALLPGFQGEAHDNFKVPAGKVRAEGMVVPLCQPGQGAGSTMRADPAHLVPVQLQADAWLGSAREAPRVPTCGKHGDTR